MIKTEKQVLITAKQIAKFNLAILEVGKYDGTLGDYLLKEVEYNALVSQRDDLLEEIAEYDRVHNPDRKGRWFMMMSGHRFWPLDPRPQEIYIEDIAYNLGMLCRFCGSVRRFYSVGQHSVLVSQVVHPRAALAGLLHDASEAYLGDVIKPIKRELPEYAVIEDRVMHAVCVRFGLDPDHEALWKEVKRGDNIMLTTEFRDVARAGCRTSMPEEPPMKKKIGRCWWPRRARAEFLQRFEELYGREKVNKVAV